MKIELRNKYLSNTRYRRYLIATTNNNKRAKKLYNANIRLAQAFHPILSQFEVIIRNSINNKLSNHFSDQDWIINQKTGFMDNNSLRQSNFFLKRSIQKTEDNLTKRLIPITSGKIISDQTFGFWIAFFLSHHYTLVGGQPIHIFTNKPISEDRASIYDKLDDIRNFRNRVNHCEPICFLGNNIDCTQALEIQLKLHSLVNWIDPKLSPYFKSIDSVKSKVIQIMSI